MDISGKMQHSPGGHGRGAAVCKETELGPFVKPNKQYFFWFIVSRSIVRNCCLFERLDEKWESLSKCVSLRELCSVGLPRLSEGQAAVNR